MFDKPGNKYGINTVAVSFFYKGLNNWCFDSCSKCNMCFKFYCLTLR